MANAQYEALSIVDRALYVGFVGTKCVGAFMCGERAQNEVEKASEEDWDGDPSWMEWYPTEEDGVGVWILQSRREKVGKKKKWICGKVFKVMLERRHA